jgi:hypothetical protein
MFTIYIMTETLPIYKQKRLFFTQDTVAFLVNITLYIR